MADQRKFRGKYWYSGYVQVEFEAENIGAAQDIMIEYPCNKGEVSFTELNSVEHMIDSEATEVTDDDALESGIQTEPVEPLEARQVAYVYPDADVLAIADDNSTFSMVLNVDSVLDCERDEPVPEAEQKLIDICKQAKAQGIGDIIIGG